MKRWPTKPLAECCVEMDDRCGRRDFPVFSVSKNLGILPQAERFKKRIASADTSRYKVVKPGDFAFDPMLLWSGSISRHTSQTTGVVSPAYCVFRLVKDVNPRFLHLYLTHPDRLPLYDSVSFGTNERRRKAQFSDFAKLEIPVPPMSEQERMVKLLDEADELRTLRAQAEHRTADLLPALFNEMFGDPFSNQRRWPLVRLDAIGTWTSGGTPPRSNPQYFTGDIDWYSAGELNNLYLQPSAEKITKEAIEQTSAKLFPKGSLLVGMYDTAAFKMGILTKDASSNQACASVSLNAALCAGEWLYVSLLLMKEHFLKQRRGIRQQNLSLAMIKAFEIPLPPLPLQEEFVQRVADIRELEAGQTSSRRRLDDLFQSMLHRAFNGEL